jgi:hypothetical protein
MTLSIMTLSIMTLSIMTLSIMTLSIMSCGECYDLFIAKISVIMPRVIMLSVVMLNVVLLSVVAPDKHTSLLSIVREEEKRFMALTIAVIDTKLYSLPQYGGKIS